VPLGLWTIAYVVQNSVKISESFIERIIVFYVIMCTVRGNFQEGAGQQTITNYRAEHLKSLVPVILIWASLVSVASPLVLLSHPEGVRGKEGKGKKRGGRKRGRGGLAESRGNYDLWTFSMDETKRRGNTESNGPTRSRTTQNRTARRGQGQILGALARLLAVYK